MGNITEELARVERSVATDGEVRRIAMSRRFEASRERVWAALTEPERLAQWFLPVTGDLQEGGVYQLEGNASGDILRCHAPAEFRLTWHFGEPQGLSEVTVALSGDDAAEFAMEHAAEFPAAMWDQYGAGAVGVGWDGALYSLVRYLEDGVALDPDQWMTSEDALRLNELSAAAWGEAQRADGASDEAVERAVRETIAFYAGD
ncbi:SRPBCC domain-containing protein [Salininema proteolyticum]|uniref:SRPBCC domain-containing protein n=1 Tax=Salininema proteolyticum TaxID=1607685 RepID=A0ABV8TWT4_9ACTN